MKNIFLTVVILIITTISYSQTTNPEMPIGSVVAWSGNRAMLPEGWLVCDGSQISKDNYPTLCSILGNSWGPMDADVSVARLFYLPDLRGVFLRGVNEGRNDTYADIDAEKRNYKISPKPANFQSNQVGSFQTDTLQNHSHKYRSPINGSTVSHPAQSQVHADFGDAQTDKIGGNETRPNNAYVYWIIKAK